MLLPCRPRHAGSAEAGGERAAAHAGQPVSGKRQVSSSCDYDVWSGQSATRACMPPRLRCDRTPISPSLPPSLPPSPPVRRVLLKEPAASEITPSDVFRFNAAFASRLYRVKINNLQMQ